MSLTPTAGKGGLAEAFPGGPVSGTAPPRRGIEQIDDPLGDDDRAEFRPSGDGTSASTSSGTFVDLLTVEPDRGSTFLLEEVSVSLEGNGEAQIGVGGDVYGPFSGAVDIAIPFDAAKLPYGGLVRIQHRSTDGSSTDTQAFVSGQEV